MLFRSLDATVQLWVVDGAPSTTPPTTGLVDGVRYIVPDSATGVWATHDRKIASWSNGWTFLTPRPGWRVWDQAGIRMTIFTGLHDGGGRWQAFQAARQADIGTLTAVTTFAEVDTHLATIASKIDAWLAAEITAGLMAADPLTKVVDESITIAEVVVDVLNP